MFMFNQTCHHACHASLHHYLPESPSLSSLSSLHYQMCRTVQREVCNQVPRQKCRSVPRFVDDDDVGAECGDDDDNDDDYDGSSHSFDSLWWPSLNVNG